MKLIDGSKPGELDAGGPADGAPPAVAADEVRGSQRRAVGELDVDAGVVLAEADHLATHEDRHAELVDPAGEDPFEVALPEREAVVVAGREVADVEGDVGVALDLHRLSLGEEAIGDAALVEHLDRAGVEPAGARAVELPAGPSFDDDDIDAGQRQLAGQHHPGRAATGDHDGVAASRVDCTVPVGHRSMRAVAVLTAPRSWAGVGHRLGRVTVGTVGRRSRPGRRRGGGHHC